MGDLKTHESRDAAPLRRFLQRDPVAAGYLLGDLDPAFFDDGRWLVTSREGELVHVLLEYRGLSTPALLSYGEPDGLASALEVFQESLPVNCHAKLPLHHEAEWRRRYELPAPTMLRNMGLAADDLRPVAPAHSLVIRRLDGREDLDRVLEAYADYPGNHFEASALRTGLYLGGFEGGRLVTVAGTHVVSPREGIAVLGNIVTRADARGRGHGTACTSALVQALRDRGCRVIALQVEIDNAAAIASYRHLGFRFDGFVLQAECRRRG